TPGTTCPRVSSDACVPAPTCVAVQGIAALGYACTEGDREKDCRTCSADPDCEIDPCVVQRCIRGTCGTPSPKTGYALATCAFTLRLDSAACADASKRGMVTIRNVQHLENRAHSLVTTALPAACALSTHRGVPTLYGKAKRLLSVGIVRANAARNPFDKTISD